jgi:epoxyqueuosine reductase
LIIINENGSFGNHAADRERLPGHAPAPWDFLVEAARELGFAAVGVAPAGPVPAPARAAFGDWLDRGLAADMEYLSHHRAQRWDPRHPRMLADASAIVCVALPYGVGSIRSGLWKYVAAHARSRDYHVALHERLAVLAGRIADAFPGSRWRTFVDTAPLLERSWAIAAGLGAQGRHGGLVVPGIGARVLLGEILCGDVPPPSIAGERPIDPCGDCVSCAEACPTGAIVGQALVDARRCLSYHTIEQRRAPLDAQIRRKLKLVFGCDICTAVCPLERSGVHCRLEPPPHPGPATLGLAQIPDLEDTALGKLLEGTCLARGGPALVKRNARALLDARTP